MEAPKIKLKLTSSLPASMPAPAPAQPAPPPASTSSTAASTAPATNPTQPADATNASQNPFQMRIKTQSVKLKFGGAGKPGSAGVTVDSDEEYPDLIEEHAILRMPRGDPLTERLKKAVKSREGFPSDLQIQWIGAFL